MDKNQLIYFKVEASKVTRVAGKVEICRKESRVLPGALNQWNAGIDDFHGNNQ